MPKLLRFRAGPIILECQYFEEYLADGGNLTGCFTRDLACHALWYYYILAMKAYTEAKKNLVLEHEASKKFDTNTARNILVSVSNLYGQKIEDMIKFWPLMEQQRIMLGGGDTLPSEFKFQFSVN
jgi:hypothetical protein